MSTALLNLTPDNLTGDNFTNWAGGLSAQFAARGLIKTADTGQINFAGGASVSASSTDANVAYAVGNAFDANIVNAWRSAALPTQAAPQWVMFDAGAGSTFTPRSWTVYQKASPNDAADVVLQSSNNPAGPWADVEARLLPNTEGHIPSNNIPSAPAARCYRLLINSAQGGAGFVQLAELQLWTGLNLSGARAQAVNNKPTAANQSLGYEIWRMNGALQNTAPAFLKIEYGSSVYAQYPGLWLSCGSATDGAGNLTGTVSERRQLRANGNVAAPQKCAFSGANNRFASALFYATNGYMWFAWERAKNSDGTDSAAGQILVATSAYDRFQIFLPSNGSALATETDLGCIGPTGATGGRGLDISVYGIKPFMPDEGAMMSAAFGYFSADLTAESVVTGLKLYGQAADRTILPLGGSITPIMRGNNASRLALLWE